MKRISRHFVGAAAAGALAVLGLLLAIGPARAGQGIDCLFEREAGNGLALVCTASFALEDLGVQLAPGTSIVSVTSRTQNLNCDPPGSNPIFFCRASPPLAPGTPAEVGVVTGARYAANDDDFAVANADPPVEISGPPADPSPSPTATAPPSSSPPPGGTPCHWDWDVAIEPELAFKKDAAGALLYDAEIFAFGAIWNTHVANVGPCTSPATTVTMSTGLPVRPDDEVSITYHALAGGADPPRELRTVRKCRVDGFEVVCPIRPLTSRTAAVALFGAPHDDARLRPVARAEVACQPAGEANRCQNNRASMPWRYDLRGLIKRLLATIDDEPNQPARRRVVLSGEVPGSARAGGSHAVAGRLAAVAGVRRVQVAVARRDAAGTSCRWVRNARARLGPAVEGCVRPVWLDAKGTRNWVYRLRRSLPKGRYEAFARGIDRRGRAQAFLGERSRDAFTLR